MLVDLHVIDLAVRQMEWTLACASAPEFLEKSAAPKVFLILSERCFPQNPHIEHTDI